jgi:dipeptidyl aminopeptidase/acylaminoacyl peptidase
MTQPTRAALMLSACALAVRAEVREFPGGQELPHDRYIHVVPESDSPVQQVYIKSKDGLYIAAAMRKPKGSGPFPALIHFHGAPGGRGMEKLVTWSRGDTGSPFFERFLKEGYVVVVADYRGGQNLRALADYVKAGGVTYADDAVAVVDFVKSQPFVDSNRLHVYGVSLGGDVTMHLLSRVKLRAAVLGAGAPLSFLAVQTDPNAKPEERFKNMSMDRDAAMQRINAVQTPLLILVGTKDSLLPIDRRLHDLMAEAGKPVRMEVYENGYHDFVMGPQGHAGRAEPLMDITLTALENTLKFLRDPSTY